MPEILHRQDTSDFCGAASAQSVLDALGRFQPDQASLMTFALNHFLPGEPDGVPQMKLTAAQLAGLLNFHLDWPAQAPGGRRQYGRVVFPFEEGFLARLNAGVSLQAPAVLLMRYHPREGGAHPSGTHWVVIREQTVSENITGYTVLDPWATDYPAPPFEHSSGSACSCRTRGPAVADVDWWSAGQLWELASGAGLPIKTDANVRLPHACAVTVLDEGIAGRMLRRTAEIAAGLWSRLVPRRRRAVPGAALAPAGSADIRRQLKAAGLDRDGRPAAGLEESAEFQVWPMSDPASGARGAFAVSAVAEDTQVCVQADAAGNLTRVSRLEYGPAWLAPAQMSGFLREHGRLEGEPLKDFPVVEVHPELALPGREGPGLPGLPRYRVSLSRHADMAPVEFTAGAAGDLRPVSLP